MAKENSRFASIIIVHYAMNKLRSELAMKSIQSLLEETKYPYELIVVDNGGEKVDTDFFFWLIQRGKIHTYIKNTSNMHFGFARNQGIQVANGDYIVIVDNDIYYKKGWLEKCVSILEAYPDEKIYSTPVYNVAHWQEKYWKKETLELDGEQWRLNRRAGSNCFVIRRKDLEEIGQFTCHRVAGTKWTEAAFSLGYWAAVTPNIMIADKGFRQGYSYKTPLPVKIKLGGDGKEVHFNDDEYKRNHQKDKKFQFIKQGQFSGEARL